MEGKEWIMVAFMHECAHVFPLCNSPTIHFAERSPTIDLLQREVQQEIYQQAHKVL